MDPNFLSADVKMCMLYALNTSNYKRCFKCLNTGSFELENATVNTLLYQHVCQ